MANSGVRKIKVSKIMYDLGKEAFSWVAVMADFLLLINALLSLWSLRDPTQMVRSTIKCVHDH